MKKKKIVDQFLKIHLPTLILLIMRKRITYMDNEFTKKYVKIVKKKKCHIVEGDLKLTRT